MEKFLKSFIANNRRNFILRNASRLAMRFLNAYHNTGYYEFDDNGEAFALKAFAEHAPADAVIWDVGAHHGEYAIEAHGILPQARIVSFEIVPAVAAQLRARIRGDWFELKEMGLSNEPGEVEVVWNRKADTTSSVAPMMSEYFQHDELERVICPVSTVDELVKGGMQPPTFLKIDVEGHEAAVLDGASELLAGPDAPLMIQFEYGMTWIPSSRLLHDVQQKLEAAGYSIGRLYPDHVEFKPYDWSDEHFRMGNMIAVRDDALKARLS
ncbi:FkbM family methyltransferase [Altererythrobacter atlanticus]|uniref:Uncharacterized protein n=1 Tax=Croceibacterium atlanticum TaxID=1267766 RepID=A0A0F7KVK8_9SPHN|nr:FkbM family methyltransferase [Croceibacterium atlanticum]AKH42795.1 hypothetical protein WYH_01759 [Croceibacterium atlanticum]MBB5731575.1 FkbM family methyltransferase [Croceibacterium atlanticum]